MHRPVLPPIPTLPPSDPLPAKPAEATEDESIRHGLNGFQKGEQNDKEGYEITFANPKGNTPQMDVNSAIAQFFGGDEAKLQDYLKFRDSLTGLTNPTRISDVIASGLDQYDAVFVPGGHGPMMDLLDDPDAGTVMRHFHKTSKPTAVLCHGPISLLSALPNSTEVVGALSGGRCRWSAGKGSRLDIFWI